TFAGHRGAIAFFCSGPGSAAAPCAEARRRWAVTRARATLFARVATQLRRVYAAGLPAARRERLRSWLAAAAAETLVRRRLGRLARWLRILGNDVAYGRHLRDRTLVECARREGRLLLTRDTRLLRDPHLPRHLFIESDHFREQLRQVAATVPLSGAPLLTRC